MKVLYPLLVLFLLIGVQNVYFSDITVTVNGHVYHSLDRIPIKSGDLVTISGKFVDDGGYRSIVVEYVWNGETKIVNVGPDGWFTITFRAPNWPKDWCGKDKVIVKIHANDPSYYWVGFWVKAICLCPTQGVPTKSVKIGVEVTNVAGYALAATGIALAALYLLSRSH